MKIVHTCLLFFTATAKFAETISTVAAGNSFSVFLSREVQLRRRFSTERINAASLHQERKKIVTSHTDYLLLVQATMIMIIKLVFLSRLRCRRQEVRTVSPLSRHCQHFSTQARESFQHTHNSYQFRNRAQTIFSTYKSTQSCPSKTASATFAAAS